MTLLRKLSFLLFIGLLAFSSCKKDKIEDDIVIIEPSPEVIVDGSLTGVVIDQNGTAIQNTEIRVGVHSITTDENGVFTFKNIKLNEAGALVTAEKDGYFYNAKFIRPELNKMAFTKIMLIEKTLSGTFDATSGGSVLTNGDAKVDIPANGVKLEGGGAYTGNVNVYATWLDPTGENLLLEMPGDLRGTNIDEQQVQLVTYGMIGVELEGDGGEPLNIADGKTATIELPVPTELLSSAPATIPLWHFDEASGYWIEDGEATLQGNKYVGTVSHFSFWNCDDPNFFIDLTGTVVDENDSPIQWLQVEVENNSNGTAGYGWTNQDGLFNGFVPKDELLTIRVYDQCGAELYSADIGPFSDDTTIDPIVVDVSNTSFTLSGSLVDCPDGNPISNGYIKVSFDGSYHIFPLSASGTFTNTVSLCSATSIEVTGYDLNALVQSEPTTYDITGLTELDLGEISTCEELAEYFNIDLDGNQYTFVDPTFDGGGAGNMFIGGFANTADSTYVFLNVTATATGTIYNPNSFDAGVFDGTTYHFAGCQGDCSGIEVIFETIDETSGTGLIKGDFTGEATDWNTGLLVPVSGSFKVIPD